MKHLATLLLNLPKNIDSRWDYDSIMHPLGLASISSYLKAVGHKTILYDAHAYHKLRHEIVSYVEDVNPDILGMGTMTYNLPAMISFVRDIKKIKPRLKIVVGGPHVSAEYQDTLERFSEIDVCVIGEGEQSMAEIIHHWQNDEDLCSVAGIAYRDEQGDIQVNQDRPFIKHLDEIPFPDWDALPMNRYWDVFTTKKNYGRIFASRGCPYKCSFCGAPEIMGKLHRRRSPAEVEKEINYLWDHHGVREILFNDSTLNVHRGWIQEVCERLIANKRNLTWRCNIRADRATEEQVRLLKAAGCVKVIMGIESGDEEVLKLMKKGETNAQVQEGIAILRKVGMPSDHGFILGMPGETEESMKKSIEFAKSISASVVTFSLATPFPGTPFYNEAVKEGWEVKDWALFDYYGVPYVPQGLTEEIMKKYYKLATREFYFRPKYLYRRLLEMRSLTNLRINLWFFFRILLRRVEMKNMGSKFVSKYKNIRSEESIRKRSGIGVRYGSY